ncbi:MAG: hypothetical protein AAGA86_04680, partial [Bacteroidota bacterium]
YTLRAYTRYLLNEESPMTFEKRIPVWSQDIDLEPTPDIQDLVELGEVVREARGRLKPRFFPEGGHLVAGLPATLAYEIKDDESNFVSVKGRIVDDNGNTAAFLTTHEYGLGVSNFNVEAGKRYYAVFQNGGIEERFPLPDVLEEGYVLNIQNKGNRLVINISSTFKNGLDGTLLLGHLRGNVILEELLEASKGKHTVRLELPTQETPKGVAQFTLFGHQGEPLCERLVFLDSPGQDARLLINAPEEHLGHRSATSIELSLLDSERNPLKGELALSVYTANNRLERDYENAHIKSWLLLDSDLGGTIPNPDYFFEDDSYSRKALLDVLMLTHGWRRFVWKDFSREAIAKTHKFLPEKGLMIHGRTTAFENPYQPRKAQVKLSALGNLIYQQKVETNAQGYFSFGPFTFQDSTSIVVEAMANYEEKPKDVGIYLNAVFEPISAPLPIKNDLGGLTTLKVQKYLGEAHQNKITGFLYSPKVTYLDEVTITDEKKTRKVLIEEQIDRMNIYGMPSKRVFLDSIPLLNTGSALDALHTVPGVRVFGSYPNQRISIRGCLSSSVIDALVDGDQDNSQRTSFTATGPLFLLDGSPVDAHIIQSLRGVEVMFIDVFKGPRAAVFGVRGSCGVVAIYTQRGLQHLAARPEPAPGVASFTVTGFYKAREFYAPDYSVSRPEHNRPDYRTTLHWEPKIILDGKEKASVDFYTGDIPGDYLIRVEGITEDGRPVLGLSRFTVGGPNSKL